MKNQKGIVWIPILIMVVSVAAFSAMAYLIWQKSTSSAQTTDLTKPPVRHVAKNEPGAAGSGSVGNTNSSANTNANTNISTAGWKTYTNSTYYFSFQYPANWTVKEDEKTAPFHVTVSNATEGSINFMARYPFSTTEPDDATCTTRAVTYGGKKATEYTCTSKSAPSYNATKVIFDTLPFGWQNDHAEKNTNHERYIAGGATTTEKEILETLKFTDPTASWKTYTNTKYKYSFQYPKDWTLGDSPTSSTPSPTAADIAFDGPGYSGFRFGVRVSQPANCSSLKTCVDKNSITFGSGEATSTLTSTTLGGKDALTTMITRPTTGDWKYYAYYVYSTSNFYTVFTTAKATDDAATKPTFDEILSTFTFNETLGWKTYTNTKYAYSIKYPSSYMQSGEQKKIQLQKGKLEGDTTHRVQVYTYNGTEQGWNAEEKSWFQWALDGFPSSTLFAHKRTVTLGSNTFTAADFDPGSYSNLVYYCLVKGEKVYLLTDWRVGDTANTTNEDIISTFTFTK